MNGNVTTTLINMKHLRYRHFLQKLNKNIYTEVVELSAEVSVFAEPVKYEDRLQCEYHSIKSGEGWGGFFDCGWFHITGRLPNGIDRSNLVAILDLGGEGCVYNDNGVVQGITNVLGLLDNYQSIKGKKVNDIVIRLYESKGKKCATAININIDYASIVETDMMYSNPVKTNIQNIEFNPFEIKTMVIKRSTK